MPKLLSSPEAGQEAPMKTRIGLAVAAVLLGAAMAPVNAQTLSPFVHYEQERQDADSMNRTGVRYAQGDGVPQDYVTALMWYERAAAYGSLAALGNIATLYFYGLGVPQSYEQAAKVLGLAVDAGDADAQNKLATLYDSGLGVTQDHAQAFELYRRAAAQGYTPAMANLGRVYIEALGVERNDVRGYALLNAAVDAGIPQSMQPMAKQELQAAIARLDEQQLADARDVSGKLVASVAPKAVVRR
jgi:TPR repeat protein